MRIRQNLQRKNNYPLLCSQTQQVILQSAVLHTYKHQFQFKSQVLKWNEVKGNVLNYWNFVLVNAEMLKLFLLFGFQRPFGKPLDCWVARNPIFAAQAFMLVTIHLLHINPITTQVSIQQQQKTQFAKRKTQLSSKLH